MVSKFASIVINSQAMTHRYLFSYAPDGLTKNTKFFFVFLSDSGKDRELVARMAAYSKVNTHFLFVKYSICWKEFLSKFFDGSSLNMVWSWSYSRVTTLSPVFFRRWCKGIVSLPNIPNINLNYLPA